MRKIILSLFTLFAVLQAQNSPDEKLSLMKNSLLLGIDEQGLSVCSEILSFDQYSSVREEALFTVSEYYFALGLLNDVIRTVSQAYTFYLRYLNDYPNGEYKDIVKLRINYLESNFRIEALFRDLSNFHENERIIVEKKLSLSNLFVNKSSVYPYLFFSEGKKNKIKPLLDKYYDDIIVNNESYAVYAYYEKLISTLSQLYDVKLFTPILDDDFSYQTFEIENKLVKKEVFEILNALKEKYPKHPLTNHSYLVAVSYMIEGDLLDYDDKETKELLEYVMQNEDDKLSLRFLLTKEFLLKTKFE